MTISEVEAAVTTALKARDSLAASTLRLLLARLKNERIAGTGELSAEQVLSIVQSEYKKRKEAAAEFIKGGRSELADKEMLEAAVLERFLPAQATEEELTVSIEEMISEHSWTSKDMGIAMKALKEKFGASADGALIARLLKEKLN